VLPHIAENRNPYGALVEKPDGKNHLEDLSVDWRIILKLIFKDEGCGLD
jgi:hypothetical protein